MPTSVIKPGESLIKLPAVLQRFPVSRSKWYQGIKDGRYPAGIKLGPRASAWRNSDIDKLISSL
jgi:predicted DNA-binding transcriptional regulator AlpA